MIATVADPQIIARARADARVIGLVGGAHFTSHFFQLAMPPLFPVMKEAFGVGYAELGLMMTLFYSVSGIGQATAGFVVDRVGARVVLTGGIALLGLSLLAISQAPSYPVMLLLVVPLALGNCVFHPADYSILSASVAPMRMGRAFSVHALGGTLGYAAAPIVMLGLSALGGWRFALAAVGAAGLVLALVMGAQGAVLKEDRAPAGHGQPQAVPAPWALLFSLPILMCFAYFTFLATAGSALQNFLAPTLHALHATPIALAAGALTAYMAGQACGIVAGGYSADRFRRHELLVASGLGCASLLILLAGSVALPGAGLGAVLALAGFMVGTASAARDMLVRSTTPKGATGKVFGFVYSGLDIGSSLGPGIAGLVLDHGRPMAVFYLIAAAQLTAILTALGIGSRRAVALRSAT